MRTWHSIVTVMQKSQIGLCLTTLGLVAAGCGGGGPSGPQSKFTVTWAERSRELNGPTAAKSFRLVVRGGKRNGADYIFIGNRPKGADQIAKEYTVQNNWLLSPTTIYIEFYADYNGYGALVAYGSSPILPTDTGITMPSINMASVVSRVVVAPQSVDPTKSKDIIFTPYNSNNEIVPVSYGSAVWYTSDESILAFNHGKAVPKGISGHVSVTAKVNDVASAYMVIPVQPPVAVLGVSAGQTVKIGTLTALSQIARSGLGDVISLSPSDVTWISLTPTVLNFAADGRANGIAVGTAQVKISYINPDGSVFVSAPMDVDVAL